MKRIPSSNKEPEVSANQRQQLLDLIAERVGRDHHVVEYDPVVAMALIATDPEVNGRDPLTGERLQGHPRKLDLALAAHAQVAKYTRPQLKQVEVTGQGGGPLEVKTDLTLQVVDLIQQLAGVVTRKREE